MMKRWNYEGMKRVLSNEPLPAMVVDLDVLDENVKRVCSVAERANKTIRLATKSVRVPKLLRHILERGQGRIQGLMCYSAQEAGFLSEEGFDDLLIAYPTVQNADVEVIAQLSHQGKRIIAMADSEEHLQALSQVATAPISVCLDVDLSWRPAGLFHIGVRRSPIRTLSQFEQVAALLKKYPKLQWAGVMGYEAQIAGLPDENFVAPFLNPIKKLIKAFSRRDVYRRREEIADWLKSEDLRIPLFNGGGTGSLQSTCLEPWVTEVTVGSGILQSYLFDMYESNLCEPALAFALQATRSPEPGIITCQSGGFIASGESSRDKTPIPFLPNGLKLFSVEGCGEVQTPLKDSSSRLATGDPVFFRPAKAGEIAERFNEYLLVRSEEVVERVSTYRGLGKVFY